MKKHLLLALMAFGIGFSSAHAQKNVIKTRPLNTAATALSPFQPINLNLTYERVIIPKLTAAITLEYSPKSNLRVFDALPLDSFNLNAPQVSGFGISPSVRFYPGLKTTPRGFYLALDFFYKRYNSQLDVTVEFPYDIEVPDYGTYTYQYEQDFIIDGALTRLGATIGIGNQWLLGDHFSIDVLWIGLGVVNSTLALKLDGPLITEEEIEQQVRAETGQSDFDYPSDEVPTWETLADEFEDEVGEGISEIPYFGKRFTLEAETDGVRIGLSALSQRVRLLNFSIGVAF